MTTIEDKIKQIKAIVRKTVAMVDIREEVEQEAFIIALEHPEIDNTEDICKLAKKKVFKEEAKHTKNRAVSIYNEKGECLDDDLFFVDQSTVEQFGERKGVSDEIKEKVKKISQCIQLINTLYRKPWTKHRQSRVISVNIYNIGGKLNAYQRN